MSGAVDLSECPYPSGKCRCGICAVCGFHKHMAIHAPVYGAKPGSKPWGHEFHSADEINHSGNLTKHAPDGLPRQRPGIVIHPDAHSKMLSKRKNHRR